MPKLAVFPKAYMQALCKDGTMSLSQWIELAAQLKVDGLEWYAGFLEMKDETRWESFRKQVEDHGMQIPPPHGSCGHGAERIFRCNPECHGRLQIWLWQLVCTIGNPS